MVCHNCGEVGHKSSYCPKLGRHGGGENMGHGGQVITYTLTIH